MAENDYTPLTDNEIEKLAEITPDDIARAQERWHRDAPAEFKSLLDAEPSDDATGAG